MISPTTPVNKRETTTPPKITGKYPNAAFINKFLFIPKILPTIKAAI